MRKRMALFFMLYLGVLAAPAAATAGTLSDSAAASQYGGVSMSVGGGSSLPFTGYNTIMPVVVGLGVLAFGMLIRWALKARTSRS